MERALASLRAMSSVGNSLETGPLAAFVPQANALIDEAMQYMSIARDRTSSLLPSDWTERLLQLINNAETALMKSIPAISTKGSSSSSTTSSSDISPDGSILNKLGANIPQEIPEHPLLECPHTQALTSLDELHITTTTCLAELTDELADYHSLVTEVPHLSISDAAYTKVLEWEHAILTDLFGQILDVYSEPNGVGEAMAEERLLEELDAVDVQLGAIFRIRFSEYEMAGGQVGEDHLTELAEENRERVERVGILRGWVVEKGRLRRILEGVW